MLPKPNMLLGVNVDPTKKTFPKLVLGKKSLGSDVITKGNPPHCEKIPPRDVPLGKSVLTQENLKPLDVLLHST
jgi:hypothetical protein